MEELFSRGIMTRGPSPADPERQVGIFAADLVTRLPPRRAEEMKKFSWLPGEWLYENHVPAGRLNPAYTEKGVARFSFRENDDWICSVAPDGRETPHITSIRSASSGYLMRGSYSMVRPREGWRGERLVDHSWAFIDDWTFVRR